MMPRTRASAPRPRAWAISVCVPMPRKLKTQKMLDRAAVPTPSAASGPLPSRATKAVSTRPVSGSATSEIKTGSDSDSMVRCGARRKGWDWGFMVGDCPTPAPIQLAFGAALRNMS